MDATNAGQGQGQGPFQGGFHSGVGPGGARMGLGPAIAQGQGGNNTPFGGGGTNGFGSITGFGSAVPSGFGATAAFGFGNTQQSGFGATPSSGFANPNAAAGAPSPVSASGATSGGFGMGSNTSSGFGVSGFAVAPAASNTGFGISSASVGFNNNAGSTAGFGTAAPQAQGGFANPTFAASPMNNGAARSEMANAGINNTPQNNQAAAFSWGASRSIPNNGGMAFRSGDYQQQHQDPNSMPMSPKRHQGQVAASQLFATRDAEGAKLLDHNFAQGAYTGLITAAFGTSQSPAVASFVPPSYNNIIDASVVGMDNRHMTYHKRGNSDGNSIRDSQNNNSNAGLFPYQPHAQSGTFGNPSMASESPQEFAKKNAPQGFRINQPDVGQKKLNPFQSGINSDGGDGIVSPVTYGYERGTENPFQQQHQQSQQQSLQQPPTQQQPTKYRGEKVLVSQIPDSYCDPNILRDHFNRIVNNKVVSVDVRKSRRSALIAFESQRDASIALRYGRMIAPDTELRMKYWVPRELIPGANEAAADMAEAQAVEAEGGREHHRPGSRPVQGLLKQNPFQSDRAKAAMQAMPPPASIDIDEVYQEQREEADDQPPDHGNYPAYDSDPVEEPAPIRRSTGFDRQAQNARKVRFENDPTSNPLVHRSSTAATAPPPLVNRAMDPESMPFTEKQDLNTSAYVVGTCMDMCPAEERYAREAQRDLSLFEMVPGTEHFTKRGELPRVDHDRAVKKYARSAAAKEAARPDQIRPTPVLQRTMQYLMDEIVDAPSDIAPFVDIHNFVRDRTRAIRQDFTYQGIRSIDSIIVHEQEVRFHVFSEFILRNESVELFSSKQNLEQLDKCLISLREMYQEQENMPSASELVKRASQDEIQAYYMLLHSDPISVTTTLRELSSTVNSSPLVGLAKRSLLAVQQNDFGAFFDIVRDAPYLMACLLYRYLHDMRMQALRSMRQSFKNSDSISLQELARILLLDDDGLAEEFCETYGLQIVSLHTQQAAFDSVDAEDPEAETNDTGSKVVNFSSDSFDLDPEFGWPTLGREEPVIESKCVGISLSKIMRGAEQSSRNIGEKTKSRLLKYGYKPKSVAADGAVRSSTKPDHLNTPSAAAEPKQLSKKEQIEELRRKIKAKQQQLVEKKKMNASSSEAALPHKMEMKETTDSIGQPIKAYQGSSVAQQEHPPPSVERQTPPRIEEPKIAIETHGFSVNPSATPTKPPEPAPLLFTPSSPLKPPQVPAQGPPKSPIINVANLVPRPAGITPESPIRKSPVLPDRDKKATERISIPQVLPASMMNTPQMVSDSKPPLATLFKKPVLTKHLAPFDAGISPGFSKPAHENESVSKKAESPIGLVPSRLSTDIPSFSLTTNAAFFSTTTTTTPSVQPDASLTMPTADASMKPTSRSPVIREKNVTFRPPSQHLETQSLSALQEVPHGSVPVQAVESVVSKGAGVSQVSGGMVIPPLKPTSDGDTLTKVAGPSKVPPNLEAPDKKDQPAYNEQNTAQLRRSKARKELAALHSQLEIYFQATIPSLAREIEQIQRSSESQDHQASSAACKKTLDKISMHSSDLELIFAEAEQLSSQLPSADLSLELEQLGNRLALCADQLDRLSIRVTACIKFRQSQDTRTKAVFQALARKERLVSVDRLAPFNAVVGTQRARSNPAEIRQSSEISVSGGFLVSHLVDVLTLLNIPLLKVILSCSKDQRYASHVCSWLASYLSINDKGRPQPRKEAVQDSSQVLLLPEDWHVGNDSMPSSKRIRISREASLSTKRNIPWVSIVKSSSSAIVSDMHQKLIFVEATSHGGVLDNAVETALSSILSNQYVDRILSIVVIVVVPGFAKVDLFSKAQARVSDWIRKNVINFEGDIKIVALPKPIDFRLGPHGSEESAKVPSWTKSWLQSLVSTLGESAFRGLQQRQRSVQCIVSLADYLTERLYETLAQYSESALASGRACDIWETVNKASLEPKTDGSNSQLFWQEVTELVYSQICKEASACMQESELFPREFSFMSKRLLRASQAIGQLALRMNGFVQAMSGKNPSDFLEMVKSYSSDNVHGMSVHDYVQAISIACPNWILLELGEHASLEIIMPGNRSLATNRSMNYVGSRFRWYENEAAKQQKRGKSLRIGHDALAIKKRTAHRSPFKRSTLESTAALRAIEPLTEAEDFVAPVKRTLLLEEERTSLIIENTMDAAIVQAQDFENWLRNALNEGEPPLV